MAEVDSPHRRRHHRRGHPGGGSPGLFTSYAYSGPAWHYDDNEVVKAKYRTYGQWRGYQSVYTYPAEHEASYYAQTKPGLLAGASN